jgi:DNA-binding GntR family transcriptional regulator
VPRRRRRRPGRAPAGPYLYAALRDLIVRAELAPGERLSEAELGGRLGVSRTPIREALGRLRDDRLVEVRPQIGTFVARISPQAVSDAQFIREALECTSVRVSAELATEESMAQLEENLRAQERATDRIDIDAWQLLDDTYHRQICDLSGHPAVWPVNGRAKSHLNRLRGALIARRSGPVDCSLGEGDRDNRSFTPLDLAYTQTLVTQIGGPIPAVGPRSRTSSDENSGSAECQTEDLGARLSCVRAASRRPAVRSKAADRGRSGRDGGPGRCCSPGTADGCRRPG